jgi:DNA polymerase elongation subunit (family B)
MLTVKPHSWKQDEVNGRSVVDIFAHDRNSKNVFLRIVDAPISCYMQLPLRGPNGDFICWNSELADLIFEYLSKKLYDSAPLDGVFEMREKLFFSEDVTHYPFIRLTFSCSNDMRKCSSYHKRIDLFGGFTVEYWEDDIKLITRLQAVCNITHTAWLACTGVTLHEKTTRCAQEYAVCHKSIFPIPEDECQSWIIYPLVCSWDGEMFSKNYRALPKASNSTDALYLVSANLENLNKPETRRYYVFLYGNCNKPTVENTTVYRFKDAHAKGDGEFQMLYAFGQFLLDQDPDVITGYNINGFDFSYIHDRFAARGLVWIYVGRYLQTPPVCIGGGMRSVSEKQGIIYDAPNQLFYVIDKPPYTGNTWKSAGRGTQNLKYYHADGRVIIDLLPVIKDSYKLDRYDLGFVSRKFINADKNPVTPQEMFRIYESSFNETPETLAEMTLVVDYCIQDSDLVLDLLRKLDIWTGLNEMSNIVAVSMEETYMRGQQQRCVNLLFKYVYAKGYVFDRLKGDCEGYAGGSVDSPIPGFYAMLLCMDFKSLYPSIIIYYLLCYRSCIPRKFWHLYPIEKCNVCKFIQQEADVEEPEFLSVYTDTSALRKKDLPTHPVEHEYRFFKERETVLPAIEKELIARRRATIRRANAFPEYSSERNILDKRQLALKIQANSFYGFLGVPYDKGGKCPCFEIARSVTAYGRAAKKLLGDYIRDTWGGEIVYGDTDSVIGATPIPVFTDTMSYIPIECLYQKASLELNQNAEILDVRSLNYRTWTEKGWTNIVYIKKHTVVKRLYNVLTTQGHVIVTADHSLVRSDGTAAAALTLNVGQRLMHHDVTQDASDSYDEIFVYVSVIVPFMSYYHAGSLHLRPQNLTYATYCMREFLAIISPGVTVQVEGKVLTFSNDLWYQKYFCDGIYRKLPDFVYNYDILTLQSFFHHFNKLRNKEQPIGSYPLLVQSGIFTLMNRLRRSGYIYNRDSWDLSSVASRSIVEKIIDLGINAVTVYDLETENHHFGVGPGNLIVHNSCMVRLPQVKKNEDCQEWGERIAQVVSGYKAGDPLPNYGYRSKEFPEMVHKEGAIGIFHDPMAIEFEKAMDMIVFCKKYYAYFVILPDGSYKEVNGQRVIENKGIVTAKRGIAKHLTNYYRKCLYSVLMRRPMLDTLHLISEAIELLMQQKVVKEDLVATTSVAASYAKATHLSKFSENMAMRGTPVVPGDKFGYIVVQGKKGANVGEKMRLSDRYEGDEPIDWEHYILKVIGKPLSTLFYLSYFEELDNLHHVRYKPRGAEGASGLSSIVKTLYRWYRDGGTKEKFLEYIEWGRQEALKPRPYIYVAPPDQALAMALAAHKKYKKHCPLFYIEYVDPSRQRASIPPPPPINLT